MKTLMSVEIKKESPGRVHCPICTHTVEAKVTLERRILRVTPGQKCPRCAASLDAGYVLQLTQAA